MLVLTMLLWNPVVFCLVKVVESSLYLLRIQHYPALPLSTTNKLFRYDTMDSQLYRSIQNLRWNWRPWYLFQSFPCVVLHHGMSFLFRTCSRTSTKMMVIYGFSIKNLYYWTKELINCFSKQLLICGNCLWGVVYAHNTPNTVTTYQ